MQPSQFSINLVKYRKRKGLTQGQLATLLCVTPQAISKWENGNLPDSSYLLEISRVLGISLDVLFGLCEERETPDTEQLVVNYIQSLPAAERADAVMHLCYAMMSAYHDYTLSKVKYPQDLELETFAELHTQYEISLARLNENLPFFCFMKTPPEGVNSYAVQNERTSVLFATLADPDAIRLIFYLGSAKRNVMQSLEMVAQKLSMPLEKVKHVITTLDRLGLAWSISAEISENPPSVYAACGTSPLVFVVSLATAICNYIENHALFVDRWEKGPFTFPAESEKKEEENQ